MTSVVPILSGGLDSTTMVYHLKAMGYDIKSVVLFNYGQRHKKELSYAYRTAEKLGIRYHVIDLYRAGVTRSIAQSGSSLVSDTDVPEGHYAQDNMKATVVPNRNMMMLAIAGAIAVAEEADAVATGVHAGDHFIYPDCRPEFIDKLSGALTVGNEGFGHDGHGAEIIAPFLHMTKQDIAHRAIMLDVPLHMTWSCYKGEEIHCGKCGTCVERLEAIHGAIEELRGLSLGSHVKLEDKTEYADNEFWKTAVV